MTKLRIKSTWFHLCESHIFSTEVLYAPLTFRHEIRENEKKSRPVSKLYYRGSYAAFFLKTSSNLVQSDLFFSSINMA